MPEIRSVAVYCGSFSTAPQHYKDIANQVGTQIGAAGLMLVYGGSTVGLMGITANAVLEAGGRATGVIPTFLSKREPKHPGLTELIEVEDMHTRKRIMAERADAFIILPGGFGTLDELAEIMTWRQLDLHRKPIVALNVHGYWDGLQAQMAHMAKEGFIKPQHADLVRFHNDPATLLEVLLEEGEKADEASGTAAPGPAHVDALDRT